MSLRRRSYLAEAIKKGALRKTGIPGLSYRIDSKGSKKYLAIVHDKTGHSVTPFREALDSPTKVLKEVVALLKSKYRDMDWTVDLTDPKLKSSLVRAAHISLELGEIFRKHEVELIKYTAAMKAKGFA
jgi:hypothetical protein